MWEDILGKILAVPEEREQALLLALANLFALTGVLGKLAGEAPGAAGAAGPAGLEPLLLTLLEQRRAGGGGPGPPVDPAGLVQLLAGHLPPRQAALLGLLSSLWSGGPGAPLPGAEVGGRRPVVPASPGRDRAAGTAGRVRENGGAIGETGAAAGPARSDTASVRRPGGRKQVLCWDPRLAGKAGNNRQG